MRRKKERNKQGQTNKQGKATQHTQYMYMYMYMYLCSWYMHHIRGHNHSRHPLQRPPHPGKVYRYLQDSSLLPQVSPFIRSALIALALYMYMYRHTHNHISGLVRLRYSSRGTVRLAVWGRVWAALTYCTSSLTLSHNATTLRYNAHVHVHYAQQ